MKESSEQHLVIKTHLQNSVNPVQKAPKTAQNGKGPPPQEPQNPKTQNQTSPPTKNRGRRRGRGGRKSDQGDVFMRPSSRHCTVAHIPASPNLAGGGHLVSTTNGSVENGGNLCAMEMGFPTSSKSLSFAPRPGYGQAGIKCVVKANHFFAELPDKDLNHYDVRSFSLMGLFLTMKTCLSMCCSKKIIWCLSCVTEFGAP